MVERISDLFCNTSLFFNSQNKLREERVGVKFNKEYDFDWTIKLNEIFCFNLNE